jgi:hypothetical protein
MGAWFSLYVSPQVAIVPSTLRAAKAESVEAILILPFLIPMAQSRLGVAQIMEV